MVEVGVRMKYDKLMVYDNVNDAIQPSHLVIYETVW